jgi:excisionase family DNA binding protein
MQVRNKAVFTTGEAATICNLSQQTIIRCFDSGQLKGFRVPGSKFRRIPRESLLNFMKDNQIPMDGFDSDTIRVLVVDDDPDIIELFVDALGNNKRFELETATTGYDAGLKTRSFRPDVIVLDYMLPDINGNVVCQSIRKDEELADTRVLIISGMVDPSEVESLREAGANDFIKKPFEIEDVVDRMLNLTAV